jgi:hypothetical protein
MRTHSPTARVLAALLLAAGIGAVPAFAGGALEQIDITGNVPSPIPGHLVAKLVPIFWDARCIPVNYVVNNTLDPVPNPLGPAFLTLADATTAFQSAFDSWNDIPTSYIEMNITGTVANPGLRGFDFKNELTFRTAASFAAIASSPSTSLIADTTFVDGMLIDADADADVSAAITTCADVDGDGDIEFPAGFYKAGTILDNDVQYNTKVSNGLRFTVADADVDIVTRSVDLEGVAVHEDGHSHGLSHVLDNNESEDDGTGVTMFPFIDTGDPAAELSQRSLDSDDIAWSSFFYQEGTASSGPAALQPGDKAFKKAFGLIRGEVTHGVFGVEVIGGHHGSGGGHHDDDEDDDDHGESHVRWDGEPVAGASVAAFDDKHGDFAASGFSGTTQVSFNPATGGLSVIDPAFNILDGNYVIPVPKGNYVLNLEATDGSPAAAGNISLTCQIGSIFGQLAFEEERWNGEQESHIEKRTGEEKKVNVKEGKTEHGTDFVTNREIVLANFGTRDFIGFTLAPGERYYAVRIPGSQISAVLPGERIYIHAATFETFLIDASTVPLFAEAILAPGSASGTTASIDLDDEYADTSGFLGADGDFASFYFKNPHTLGKKVRDDIEDGDTADLFVVLRLPPGPPFPGVSNRAPLIGLDGGVAVNDVPIFGLSYISDDGGATFTQVPNFNFRFALLVSEALDHGDDD